MKNNIDDATEKSGVNKDKISGSDKQGDRNVEIIDVNMEVEQWYSIANLIYVLLVGYVWVRYMMGNPASGNVLRLIDSIFIWMGTVDSTCSEGGTAESKAANLVCMAGCDCCIVCTGDCWCCGMMFAAL